MSMDAAYYGAVTGVAGIVAQVSLPIPEDLQSWPVTALLALIVLSCLAGRIATRVIDSATATASAVAALAAEDRAGAESLRNATTEMREGNKAVLRLCATLEARPCLR
jgi:hypothetical protein